MTTQPLVSVLMPVFNHELYIEESIDSVLSQNYDNIQLVAGDDRSVDGSWEIVQRYQKKYPDQVLAFRNEQNLGMTGNNSKIVNQCSGKYLAMHAGDDVWLPNKLSLQVELMESQPECVFSYHDLVVFDSDTGETRYHWNSGERRPIPLTGESTNIAHLMVEEFAGFFGAQSVMVRRESIRREPAFDPRLPHLAELLLWLDVLLESSRSVCFIPEVLGKYRKHEHGISQQNNETEIDLFLAIVENEYAGFENSVRRSRGRRYYNKGVDHILRGDGKLALTNLYQAARYHVISPKIFYWIMRALLQLRR